MKVRTKIKLLCYLMIFTVIVGVYYFRVSATMLEVGDADAEAKLSTAVYSVLNEMTGTQDVSYENFFTITKGDDGITLFLANGMAINRFTGSMAEGVCAYLKEYADRGTEIPSGVFSGLRLLSGYGSMINFKLIKIASVKCDLISEFTSAGINQVKHSLYVNVTPEVTLKAVGRSKHVEACISVLIFENVIVGKVPDTYLGATIVH